MNRNRIALSLLILALLTFGQAPGTNATICTDDPLAIPYVPSVDTKLLNHVLDLLGEIPLVDFEMEMPFEQDFEHTMHVVMNGSVNLSVDFIVTPGTGTIEVELLLPAWDADMDITLEHAPCRDCIAEWTVCNEPCVPAYNGCSDNCTNQYDTCDAPCDPNYYGCVAGCWEGPPGDWCRDACYNLQTSCHNFCTGAKNICDDLCIGARNICQGDCNLEQGACNIHVGFCNNEATLLNNLLDGHTIGMSYDSGSLIQRADVCVTETCEAVHPLVSTNATLENFHMRYFPENDPLGFGLWLNGKFTEMVNNIAPIPDEIESFLVNEETGEGVLINAFGTDIKNDGCAPVQEVQDCRGAACSITATPDIGARQSASILLYSLPMLIMGIMILWRRRR